jgi:hypothetical protein
MALEFALRPRFDLERPAPERRPRRLRLPRLALPIAAYWLAMAGATHALLRLTAEDATARGTEPSAPSHEAAVDDAFSSEAFAGSSPTPSPAASGPPVEQQAALEPRPAPDVAPAPVAAPPEEPADVEPTPERSTPTPAPAAAPTPAARRAVVARPEPSPPAARTEPHRPERRTGFSPFDEPELTDEPAPRESDPPKARARQEPLREAAPAISLPSCESVAASANQSVDIGGARGAPDLTRDAFASVLENGSYLAGCALPARTRLDICAAVRDGKVVGVSAVTTPRSPSLDACVRRAVAALRFPHSPRLDVTRTRFEAER